MRKKKQIELESGKRVSGPEFRGEKVARRMGVWESGGGAVKLVATCCSLKDKKKKFPRSKVKRRMGKLEPIHGSPAGCTGGPGVSP